MDVVIVMSAGNWVNDVTTNSPERLREVLTVASTGQNEVASTFSNFGWLLDINAPGGGSSKSVPGDSGRRNTPAAPSATIASSG